MAKTNLKIFHNELKRSPLERFTALIENVQPSGTGWSGRCPAHCDTNSSLAFNEGDDGRVLVHCHAGCTPDQIVSSIGWALKDLFRPVYGNAKCSGVSPSVAVALASDIAAEKSWAKKAKRYQRALTEQDLQDLAAELHLPAGALKVLGVGLRALSDETRQYTFPERRPSGDIVGIATRSIEGTKRMIKGGHRGLYIPPEWDRGEGPIFVVEGPTCTAALIAMKLAGVGRPSAPGGRPLLLELFAGLPAQRQIIVMAEFDPKQDGRWPGLEAAKAMAAKLSEAMNRQIGWALPPKGKKDVRDWFAATQTKRRS